MRRLCLLALSPMLISGCAVFAPQKSADAVFERNAPAVDVRVVERRDDPLLLRAATRPRGLMPCDEDASLTDACRRPGDVHGDITRTLMPASQ